MRVLSLGAGVQSSAVMLMALKREIEPVDAVIFADTGWEPTAVYQWLNYLEARAREAGVPLFRVGRPTLRGDALANLTESWMPLYSVSAEGKIEQLKRQCTRNYKIRQIRRQVRALGGGPRNPVQQLVGISLDEHQRMRTSDVKYITNVYPLVDLRMTRHDAVNWLARDGSPEPTKSACIACPLRTNREWRAMPAGELADAVDFDERIRRVRDRTRLQDVFVHRSGRPLAQADLTTPEDHGQLAMFQSDGCGVLCAGDLA